MCWCQCRIVTVIPIVAAAVTSAPRDGFAAFTLETREASTALTVAIAFARASEKVCGTGIVGTRKFLRCLRDVLV